MSENSEYDIFENDTPGVKQLRKNYKTLKQKLEERDSQIDLLLKQNRGASVNEALASRGLDPRVARFYPSDLGTDEASVAQWVEDNGDLFAGRRVTPDDGSQTPDETTLTDAERRGYQIHQDVAAFEAAIAHDFKSQFDQVEMKGQDWQSAQAEVMRVLKEIGNNMAQ